MSRRLSVLMAAITIIVLGASVAYASLPGNDDSSKSSDPGSATLATTAADQSTSTVAGRSDDSLTSSSLPDDEDDDSVTSTTIHDDDDGDDDSVTSTTIDDEDDDSDDDNSVTSTTIATAATTGNTTFEAPGVGTLTVSWDGATLTLTNVSPAAGWTHTVDEVTSRSVEIDFWNAGVRHRAKVEVENEGLRFEHFRK